MHTAYVPADAFGADTAREWGTAALSLLHAHAPRPDALGVDDEVYARVVAKLEREPVEDLRVDFEDGYGDRPADEEDRHARAAGTALVPPQTRASGLRIKSFEPATRARALRTLDLLLSSAGRVPEGFVVTLPKVSAPEQVRAIDEVCAAVDETFSGAPLRFELQIETPAAVARMAEIVAVAGDRCAGLHYGTYDYSAALGVAAAHQSLDHPVADHAKAVMQVAAATAGLRVVDGSSNVLPVGDTARCGPPGRCTCGWSTARCAEASTRVGPAPRPAREPICGRVLLLPQRVRGRGGSAERLPRSRVRWRARRTGHRSGACRLSRPRPRLRCARR